MFDLNQLAQYARTTKVTVPTKQGVATVTLLGAPTAHTPAALAVLAGDPTKQRVGEVAGCKCTSPKYEHTNGSTSRTQYVLPVGVAAGLVGGDPTPAQRGTNTRRANAAAAAANGSTTPADAAV